VRELRNVIERAMLLADADELGPDDLALPIDTAVVRAVVATGPDEPTRLEDIERLHIAHILETAGGSRTRAATMLGISRSTLREKAKRYGIF